MATNKNKKVAGKSPKVSAKKSSAPAKKKVVAKKVVATPKSKPKTVIVKKSVASSPKTHEVRQAPGSTGLGNFYHIIIRPKEQFNSFRVQDVGKHGGLERVAGHRPDGSWDTQAWLVEKKDARVIGGKLMLGGGAKSLLNQIDGVITHLQGDIWKAHVKHKIPVHERPTDKHREEWNQKIRGGK